MAYPPLAQLAAYVAFPELIARTDAMADASLPAKRARSRPGMAIAAMMPMIATTISSSISVNPSVLCSVMSLDPQRTIAGPNRDALSTSVEFLPRRRKRDAAEAASRLMV